MNSRLNSKTAFHTRDWIWIVKNVRAPKAARDHLAPAKCEKSFEQTGFRNGVVRNLSQSAFASEAQTAPNSKPQAEIGKRFLWDQQFFFWRRGC